MFLPLFHIDRGKKNQYPLIDWLQNGASNKIDILVAWLHLQNSKVQAFGSDKFSFFDFEVADS